MFELINSGEGGFNKFIFINNWYLILKYLIFKKFIIL